MDEFVLISRKKYDNLKQELKETVWVKDDYKRLYHQLIQRKSKLIMEVTKIDNELNNAFYGKTEYNTVQKAQNVVENFLKYRDNLRKCGKQHNDTVDRLNAERGIVLNLEKDIKWFKDELEVRPLIISELEMDNNNLKEYIKVLEEVLYNVRS